MLWLIGVALIVSFYKPSYFISNKTLVISTKNARGSFFTIALMKVSPQEIQVIKDCFTNLGEIEVENRDYFKKFGKRGIFHFQIQ